IAQRVKGYPDRLAGVEDAGDPGGHLAVTSAMLLNTQLPEGSRATALGSVPDCGSGLFHSTPQHHNLI
ncbi:MAG: hypothetical protein AABN95_26215, partial [Acidobacteriota bacterium]